MSTLASIADSFILTPSRFPRAYVGQARTGPVNSAVRGRDPREWRLIFGDDVHDYAPTGPVYRSKAEALAALPAAVADYYGPQ